MIITKIAQYKLRLFILLFFLSSCASVPEESVELSYLVGNDLRELQSSYDRLIQELYTSYRAQRIDYLENTWTPSFIATFIEDGMLREISSGALVFDESSGSFVAPTDGLEERQLLESVLFWADAAVNEIEIKRTELIAPLDDDEEEFRNQVKLSFDQLIQANAHVSSLLSSIRDVSNLQNNVLDSLGLGETVNSLNGMLIEFSDKAVKGLQNIEEIDANIIDRAERLFSDI